MQLIRSSIHYQTQWMAITLLCGAFFAQPAISDEFITIHDLFDLNIAENPQISPQGEYVVYERHFNDIDTDRRYSNLWIVRIDGTQHRALTKGPYNDREVRWSADGQELVFTSDRHAPRQIYKLQLDEGVLMRLTDVGYAPQRIDWSPDGKFVSFVAFVPSEPLSIVDPPDSANGTARAPAPQVFDQLRYRWDGIGYLDRGLLQVFIVPSKGGDARQVSDHQFPNGGTTISDSPMPLAGPATPVWSPDGKYLYVSTVRRPDYEYNVYDTEVYRIAVSDGAVKQLTDRRGPDSSPTASPDGRHVAYLGYDDRYMGYQTVQLYVMRSDGTASRSLTATLDRDVADIIWSSDSNWIYFLYVEQGETQIARVSLEGSLENLANGVGSRPTAYPSGGFSVSANAVYAYTAISADRFGRIAVATIGELESTRTIVDVNAALFSERQTGRVESIQFKSSYDRRAIDGWLVYPKDFDPKLKYPLILEIHGGPFAAYGARFDLKMQSLASRGYFVLYTNPRGSTSYGEAFGNLIHHAYPSEDFDDLQSGVDALIERGFIDDQNLFITGGSGGGILTAWTIGKTDRYRAACVMYPAVNFASWVLTSDKAFKLKNYFFPDSPWTLPEHYFARSPLSLTDGVRTPTLIMTGEEDFRTPISESEQLYTALKLRHVEAVLVRYPGENHGIGRWPSNTISTTEHLLAWFDRHRTN